MSFSLAYLSPIARQPDFCLFQDLRCTDKADINERLHRCSVAEMIKAIQDNQDGKKPRQVLNMLDIPLSRPTSRTM